MTARSVIDIDLNDEKFKSFVALFNKFDSAVKKMPGGWKNIGQSIASVNSALDGVHDNIADSAKQQSKLHNEAAKTGREFSGIAKSTKSIAGNIKDATVWLLKWSSITTAIGGLLGAGGLFGIDRLALGASRTRQTSMGLGVSAGQLNALKINYGTRGVDVEGLLSKINEARNSPYEATLFGAAHIFDYRNKSNAQILTELIPNIRDAMIRSNGNYAAIPGFSAFSDINQATMLSRMSDQEMSGMLSGYQRDEKNLGISDKTMRSWQDFDTQLERAGTQIKTVLIDGLVPLAGPLSDLSKSFAGALGDLLKNPNAKGWIHDISGEIKDFSAYLQTDKFKNNVIDFVNGVGEVATAMYNLAKFINGFYKLFGGENPGDVGDRYKENTTGKDVAARNLSIEYGGIERANHLPNGIMSAFYVQNSWMHRPTANLTELTDDAKEISRLSDKYNHDLRKALVARMAVYGEETVDQAVKDHGAQWDKYVQPGALNKANNIIIEINNNTGGNAVINTNQAAQGH